MISFESGSFFKYPCETEENNFVFKSEVKSVSHTRKIFCFADLVYNYAGLLYKNKLVFLTHFFN